MPKKNEIEFKGRLKFADGAAVHEALVTSDGHAQIDFREVEYCSAFVCLVVFAFLQNLQSQPQILASKAFSECWCDTGLSIDALTVETKSD